MSEKSDVLEQALAAIAAEETRTLEQQMTFSDMQAAKKLQLAYSKENIALIRKHTRSFRAAPFLRAAAALVVVVGGLMLLRSSMPEKADVLTPTSPSFSMQTNSPSSTQEPNSVIVTPISPTATPIINIIKPISATSAPLPTHIPSPAPTAEPTNIPSATPSPVPTAAPTITATPVPITAPQHPDGWQGNYFPGKNSGDWLLKSSGNMTAVYDDNYEFTEYDHITNPLSDARDIAEYEYMMINGVPALLTEDRTGQITLTWDVDKHTLSLFSPDGEKETLLDIANSVIKLPENN